MNKHTAQKAAQWWAEKLTGGESDADRFEKSLADILGDQSGGWCRISSDNEPDTLLTNAAAVAGINPKNIPWKTCMIICDEKIQVIDGYAAPWVTL